MVDVLDDFLTILPGTVPEGTLVKKSLVLEWKFCFCGGSTL